MRLNRLTVPLCCLLVVLGISNKAVAQGTIGVSWDVPENSELLREQLNIFQQSGIELLEVKGEQNTQTWQYIEEMGFRVYGDLDLKFPLVQTFADPDSAFWDDLQNRVTHFRNQSPVEAIGLFRYGATHNAAFDSAITPVVTKIRNETNARLYFTKVKRANQSVDELFDFSIQDIRVSAGRQHSEYDTLNSASNHFAYRPDPQTSTYLSPFHGFLEKYATDSTTVLVPSGWLLPMLEEHPDLAQTLRLYNLEGEFIFPVPEETIQRSSGHNLIILLLVLLWGMIAVNYHMSPVYRKAAARYFLGHVFFVEDVMNRHIRSIGAASVILIQNILFAGITIYCLSHVLFSTLGLESIFYHLPFLTIFPNPAFSLFLWTCLFAATLTAVSVLWIKLGNKQVKSFRQVLNLYAWPLQINFILATGMVTLLMAGNYPGLIVLLSVLFALVHISAFLITATDTSKYLSQRRGLFLLGSAGLYLLFWGASAYWFFSTNIPDILRLAVSL